MSAQNKPKADLPKVNGPKVNGPKVNGPRNNLAQMNNNSNTVNIAMELGKQVKPNLSKKILILLLIFAGFFGVIALMYYNTIKKLNVLHNETLGLFNKVQKKIGMAQEM